MILEVKNINFSYNSRPVLSDVSFSAGAGELMAILGPNGVGKTTLLKCINAIHRPSSGEILVDGQDVLTMTPNNIARSIGYVAQRSEAAWLTVFDAVLMGRKPHIKWRVSENDLKIVESGLRRLHLDELSLRYVTQLSGGELQKVSVARALVQEPHLMLLDEPTSSLDLKNQIEILKILRRVVDEHRIAAVMSMHDLNTALRYAQKFLLLKDHKVFATGHIEEITPEMIEEVYEVHVTIQKVDGFPIVVPR
jgi:iron complex transport system ATP-binding protein